jgi:hypothetical protein
VAPLGTRRQCYERLNGGNAHRVVYECRVDVDCASHQAWENQQIGRLMFTLIVGAGV